METVTLTREMLHDAATGPGGWTKKQLAVLGVPWPPPRSWLYHATGRVVPVAVWEAFVEAGKPEPTLFDCLPGQTTDPDPGAP